MQVMTDIEVVGAAGLMNVLQISSVAFDLDGKVNDPHELLQAEDCWFDAVIPNFPGNVSFDAVNFWAEPDQRVARDGIYTAVANRGEQLGSALERFSKFASARLGKKGGHWARPPSFDLDIIREHYEFAELPLPWHFRQERCQRTLMALAKSLSIKMPDMDNVGLIRHYGLHDAARQAVQVQAAYRALGLSSGNHARAERSAAAAS